MLTIFTNNHDIAYNAVAGSSPCVIFCGGFNSSMQGNKALALEQYCIEKGQAFIRFDYQGHGQSGGEFADGDISTWLADTVFVIDELSKGEIVLVGSSMGGWLALLAALRRPNRVKSLLLMACAADMTKYYPDRVEGLPCEHDEQGRVFFSVSNQFDDQEPYKVYQNLIEDGQQYLLLESDVDLSVPVHLIHGLDDDVVPWQRSQQVMNSLTSENVSLHLIKKGDHRLSKPSDLELMTSILDLSL